MLHTGTGTEADDKRAAEYWEKSAKLGNTNAQYALGKLWLETGSGDSGQAVEWLQKQQMQSTQLPSMCWGNYTRMVCILIKIWIRP